MPKTKLPFLLISLSLAFTITEEPGFTSHSTDGSSSLRTEQRTNIQEILRTIAKAEDAVNASNRSVTGEEQARLAGLRQELDAASRDSERKLYAMGSSIAPVLLDNLNDQHQHVNNTCAKLLARFGKDSIIPIINRYKESIQPNYNYTYYNNHRAVQILQQIGADCFEPLTKMLNSSDQEDRVVSAQILAELAQYMSPSNEEAMVMPSSTIEALLKATTDSNSRVKELACTALGRLGPRNPRIGETLIKVLHEEKDPKVRRKCVQALGNLAQKQTESTAEETAKALAWALVSDEYEGVRMSAAGALGQSRAASEIALPALTKALKDPHLEVKNAAINSLCNYGSRAAVAVPDLIKDLNEPNSRESQSAIRLLAKIGPAAAPAVPALVRMAAEVRPTEQYLRTSIAQVFAAIGPKALPAVPILIEMLSSRDYAVQRGAIHALGAIGPAAHAAENALRDLIEREPRLKQEAEQALLLIKKGNITNLIET